MKKWILSLIVVFLIILGFFINVYIQARKPYNAAEKKAEEIAKSKADLKDIEQFYLYNGTNSYLTVVGKQKSGQKVAVMIPRQQPSNPVVYKWSDGISEKAALQALQSQKHPKKIMGVSLGLDNNEPVWEISFLDSSSQLNYFYISFLKTGNYTKLIENI
ncbi:DUF5590 domain-containing protein [Heyndrickxia acidicola]|uniref:DUF5590 domain-containing protein n=1 Tax=Heyndrickxia acidicola TaxID=209389 RepID=A0ABU6MM22_9BACI|nr:DUF5590 domain-containing protein [Heyndrickxia acidicola]MED1205026.1 DUF5590 domain-containing protein [Heyndrickxia acidicola]